MCFTHIRGVPINDNLCFFRCVAYHQGLKQDGLEKHAKFLRQEFEEIRGKSFEQGVTIHTTGEIRPDMTTTEVTQTTASRRL